LSFRDIEELLAARGIVVTYEAVRQWVEKKIRRHLARSSKRRGFGWKRWSRRWLYDTLGLFDAYRVSYRPALLKARPVHEVP
jgi:RNA-directed DNA polymerase